jgi:tRNA A-37 threonylcarbamoyl transferase component Bud32
MRSPIQDLPAGYSMHRVGDTWLIFDAAAAEHLTQLRLAEPGARQNLFAGAPRRGRARAPSVSVTPDIHMVLRRYRHGGLLGRISGPLYLGPARALAELDVTVRAEGAGAPVPHVVCLILWPVLGPFWSAVIGTREERNATDLADALRAERDPRRRTALVQEVGSAIEKLHAAGLEHRDLQLRNILVTDRATPRIVVVDLDRAVFHRHSGVPIGRRASNLGRLLRSAVKLGLWGAPLGKRDLAAFLRGYTQGRRQLRRELMAWLPRERLKLALHDLTYRFRHIEE